MINYHMNKYMEEKFITIKKFLKNGKKKPNYLQHQMYFMIIYVKILI